ncbi:MAG: metal-dependent hydrolase [Oscillospiraceae bacterium]|jgi:inner membrane protein|nr:metal-dependent hydrolase [Oscillospiraceae bacterium]
MDSVTHAVSGTALVLALQHRPATKWAVPIAMAVACMPDIDILFSRAPIDSLLFHRGITHSLFASPILALLCALLMYPFWRRGTRQAWTFKGSALFAFSLLLIHIWLDCVTSYGTLAFLPFSDYRVRLNGMFIVDLALLVPLIIACCVAWRRPRIAAIAIIWLFLYSGGTVLWRIHLHDKWDASLRADGLAPAELSVLPDVFSPLYWKVQYEHNGQCFQAPLAWNGERTGVWEQRPSAGDLLSRLSLEDRNVRIWTQFCLLPLLHEQDWEGGKEYGFDDWRFDSFVPFFRAWRRNDVRFFRFMARVDDTGRLVAVRYVSGRGDLGWRPPVAPSGRSGIRWLIGLDN